MKGGFIGCGNMGGALIKAAAKSIDVNNIYVYDRSRDKADALARELGVISADEKGVIAETNYIFLGVKPQVLKDAIGEIKDTLKARQDRFHGCL